MPSCAGSARASTSFCDAKTWMAGTWTSGATPFFQRLCPAVTGDRESFMLPPPSPRSAELARRITAFMEEHIYPAEPAFEREVREGDHWDEPPVMRELKRKAKAAGLRNLFVPKKHDPDALSVVEYAPLCEIMGRSPIGAEPFNCSAPDTGNMETLMLYGSDAQKKRWLEPLMAGEIRSCFAMTEPAVASSDATNLRSE